MGSAGSGALEQAYRHQALDENDIMARLAGNQYQAQHDDTYNAIRDLGAFNKGDYDARSNIANFEYQNNQDQNSREDARRKQVGEQNMRLLGAATQLIPGASGIGIGAGGINTPIDMGGVGRFTPSHAPSGYDLGNGQVQPNYIQSILNRIRMGQTGRAA